MKKFFVTATLACLSTAAFANTIVPEVSRDGKTKNDSVIATSNQMRTFIAGEYSSSTREDDDTKVEVDTSNINLYGGYANKMVTVEADLNIGDDDDNDVNTYGVQVGYRITKDFALGLAYEMEDADPDSEETDLEIAVAYSLNNLVLGASFSVLSEDDGTNDGSHNQIVVGVGSNANKMSWEAGLQFDLEEKDDDITSASRTKIFAGATKVISGVELDGNVDYTMGDAAVTGDDDYSAYSVELDAEFLVTDMFYITPGFMYESTDNDTIETTQFVLSADVGYRANMLDATVGIDFYVTDESETAGTTTEYNTMAYKVNVAYTF